jgi:peptidoglycan hydrolase-like protein with peptidoglycan-binding domain
MKTPVIAMITFAAAFASTALAGATPASGQQRIATGDRPSITAEAINSARLEPASAEDEPPTDATSAPLPDAGMVRLQVLLDRAGASPGVIDGFDGANVRKAIAAFEQMRGLRIDGALDPEIIAALDTGGDVIGH